MTNRPKHQYYPTSQALCKQETACSTLGWSDNL